MPLTDTALRHLKTPTKTTKIADEKGLYIQLEPSGSKLWRLKYRFAGKEKRLSFGAYPEVSLREARDERDAARAMLRKGTDPGEARKIGKLAGEERAANDFQAVAEEWLAKRSDEVVESYQKRVVSLLEQDVFKVIGSRPIASLTPPEMLSVFRRIEARSIDQARRAFQQCGLIFRYAIATGRITSNPIRDLGDALKPQRWDNFSATMDPKRLGEILLAFDSYKGGITVKSALRIMPLVFVRPGELRRAEWSQIDWQDKSWTYTITKLKDKPLHTVPLSRQVVEILEALRPVSEHRRYLFPNPRLGPKGEDRPMSENAVLAAMRSLGIGPEEMTGHGFRAVARTILDEKLKFRPDYIEQQLSHAVRDPHGRAYNRTTHLDERRSMMQAWADYLDTIKAAK